MEDYQIKVLKDRIKEHIAYCEEVIQQIKDATEMYEYAYASGVAKGGLMTLLNCLEITNEYINESVGEKDE